jgi:DNA-binding transcriptional MocR family regulator
MIYPQGRAWLATVQRARDTLPHGQRPTDLHTRVAAMLAYWRGSRHPTHRQLARAARTTRRTVQRALARFLILGLLGWDVRKVSATRRLPNAYRLGIREILPRAKLSPPPSPAPLRPDLAAALARLGAAVAAREALARVAGRLSNRFATGSP